MEADKANGLDQVEAELAKQVPVTAEPAPKVEAAPPPPMPLPLQKRLEILQARLLNARENARVWAQRENQLEGGIAVLQELIEMEKAAAT